MTVRRRIVIGVVVLFSVVLAIAGSLSVQALQDRLVADVDQVLLERSGFIERVASRQFTFPRGDRVQDDVFPSAQDMAVVVVGADGEVVLSVPSGRSDQPDPLPDVGALDLAALAASGDVVQVEVDGGDVAYRVAVSPIGDGVGFAVLAIPLDSVHSAVGATSAILLIAGLVAVAAAGLLAWWVVRAAMRPVDDMIATAGQVAGGDLSPRIEATDDGTEMGQLAGALNTMLGRIEEAVDAKSESEARMRRFLSDASHELRTPLTSIRGYAELYRRGATSPEDVERSFDRIEREATRMSTLVEDLLLLARLDQQRPLESAPVDIAALVTEAVEAARIVDDERSISIEVPSDSAHRARRRHPAEAGARQPPGERPPPHPTRDRGDGVGGCGWRRGDRDGGGRRPGHDGCSGGPRVRTVLPGRTCWRALGRRVGTCDRQGRGRSPRRCDPSRVRSRGRHPRDPAPPRGGGRRRVGLERGRAPGIRLD